MTPQQLMKRVSAARHVIIDGEVIKSAESDRMTRHCGRSPAQSLSVLDRLWVAEYSGVQKCFHVETVEQMLRSNCRCFGKGGMVDYVPLAIVGSHEEAHRICDEIKRRFGRPGTAQEAYDNGR